MHHIRLQIKIFFLLTDDRHRLRHLDAERVGGHEGWPDSSEWVIVLFCLFTKCPFVEEMS
jgi:hypothetical protein